MGAAPVHRSCSGSKLYHLQVLRTGTHFRVFELRYMTLRMHRNHSAKTWLEPPSHCAVPEADQARRYQAHA